MAPNVSIIGRTTRVHGRVSGAVDLEVQGFVDGEITVSGDVTVDAHGMVGASIQGRRLVVRGAVRGDLIGEESVLLEDGARVVGDVRAPRVAIAPGALVRGFVETGEADAAAARTSRAAAATAPAAKPAASPAPAARQQPAPAPVRAPVAAPSAAIKSAPAVHVAGGANGNNHVAPRRPPPPVVPALKKVKGQLAKKKER